MPNPTPGAVHVDSLLTNISVGYIQSSTAFIADRVFPRVPVNAQSNKYAIYDQADFLRDTMAVRGPGGRPNRDGFRNSTGTYRADEWALEFPIDDQVRANSQAPYQPEEDGTRFLTQKLLIRREADFVSSFFSTADVWTGSSDGANLIGGTDFTRWSNAASTPIEDVHKQSARIESNTGFLPNTLVLQRQVWFDLKNHPDIVDRVKHTSAESLTTDMVARLFGLDRVLVTGAVVNSGGEGVAGSYDYMAKDHALLVYTTPSPGLMVPSAGYTFVWTGLIGSNEGQVLEMYREDQTVSDILRIRAAWDQKVVAAPVGVLFEDASTNW